MTSVLQQLDWVVLGIYFLALIGVAVWVFIQKNSNTEDYFLAGRNVGWFVIGASIFASNIGSEHVVGLAGTGFESGTPMAHYELHAWIVLLLGWLFLPFYIRSGAFTMPEFLEKRFDSRSRWFLSVFSLLAYVLTKVSITIYAGGIVVSELLGIPFWYGAIGIVVFTGIYTVIGGLKAVIYTETLQTIVLIFGSVVITYLGLQEVGGWAQLRETVTAVSPDHFNMWRPMNDPQFPWTGLLIGGTIVGNIQGTLTGNVSGTLAGNANATVGVSTLNNITIAGVTTTTELFATNRVAIGTDSTEHAFVVNDLEDDTFTESPQVFITSSGSIGIRTTTELANVSINAHECGVVVGGLGVGSTVVVGAVDMREAGRPSNNATDRFMFPPQVTTTQRGNLSGVLAGAMIYNTSVNRLQVFNGSTWKDCFT